MKQALLAVSFGTSYAHPRKAAIEAIEEELRRAFPERLFARAWTSGFIRKKLLKNEGLAIDGVDEALEKLLAAGVEDLLVQPTHMMAGEEFSAAKETVSACSPRFQRVSVGEPLLTGDEDIRRLAAALEEIYAETDESDLLAFMGHGSGFDMENPYDKLNAVFDSTGFPHFHVGTVEFEPGFDAVLERARQRKPGRIFLAPLMVVAGDHALNDMAGEGAESWASRLRGEGFKNVDCVLRGLGEYQQVRKLYIAHARQAAVISEA